MLYQFIALNKSDLLPNLVHLWSLDFLQSYIFEEQNFSITLVAFQLGRMAENMPCKRLIPLTVLKSLVYLLLLSLCIWELYRGDLLDKFQLQRTYFAEYEEEVTELPTILTYIEHDPRSSSWPKLEYGIDFNLSYGIGTSDWINLTQGENSFDNSPLKILFEVQKEHYSLDDGYLQTQVCYSRRKRLF